MDFLEFIENKKQWLRDRKGQLYHDQATAKKLGFQHEIDWIENNLHWLQDEIDLLSDMAKMYREIHKSE